MVDGEINLDNQHNDYKWFNRGDKNLNLYIQEVVGLV